MQWKSRSHFVLLVDAIGKEFFCHPAQELSREEGLPDDVDDRMDAGSLADTFTECNDDGTVDMLDTDSVSEADTNRGASYDTVR